MRVMYSIKGEGGGGFFNVWPMLTLQQAAKLLPCRLAWRSVMQSCETDVDHSGVSVCRLSMP